MRPQSSYVGQCTGNSPLTRLLGNADLKEDHHAANTRLKVEETVKAAVVLDVHEERHAKDGVDECNEEQQETNVEQGGHRDGQREQQRPDALGRLDQSQDATDTKHS